MLHSLHSLHRQKRDRDGEEKAAEEFKQPRPKKKRRRVQEESEDLTKKKPVVKAEYNASMFESKTGDGQLLISVGKSERGKTHFTKWLLDWMLDERRAKFPLKFGIAFVKTKYKHAYGKLIPDDRIFQGYNEEVLKQYVANLEAIMEEEGDVEPNFVIFEDLVGMLANSSSWFINWISTFRHLKTQIFINVQYLTGRNAISPIMREQTNVCMMFNSRTAQTIQHLYDNFGQLFEDSESGEGSRSRKISGKQNFKNYFFANTARKHVGPYVCITYFEPEDDVEKNYIPMRAPANFGTNGNDSEEDDEDEEEMELKEREMNEHGGEPPQEPPDSEEEEPDLNVQLVHKK